MLLREYAAQIGLGTFAKFVPASATVAPVGSAPQTWPECLARFAVDGPTQANIAGSVETLSERRLEHSLVAADLLAKIAVDPSSPDGTALLLWATRLQNWPRMTERGRLLDWSRRSAWQLLSDEALWVEDKQAAFSSFSLGAWGSGKDTELREFAATNEGATFLYQAGATAFRARLFGLAAVYLRLAIESNREQRAAQFLLLESAIEMGAQFEHLEALYPPLESTPDLATYCSARIALHQRYGELVSIAPAPIGSLAHAIHVLTTTGTSRVLPEPVPLADWTFGNVAALASALRDSTDGAVLATYQTQRYLTGEERAWLYYAAPRHQALLREDALRRIAATPADKSMWMFLAMVQSQPQDFERLRQTV